VPCLGRAETTRRFVAPGKSVPILAAQALMRALAPGSILQGLPPATRTCPGLNLTQSPPLG